VRRSGWLTRASSWRARTAPDSVSPRWRFADGGLIAESKGHFDEAEYRRQLKTGVASVR
jgi:hypothetical protein